MEENHTKGEVVRCLFGIDMWKVPHTTKFCNIRQEQEEILDSLCNRMKGSALKVAKEALICLRKRYEEAGQELEILSLVRSWVWRNARFPKCFKTPAGYLFIASHARASSLENMSKTPLYFDIGDGEASKRLEDLCYHKYFICNRRAFFWMWFSETMDPLVHGSISVDCEESAAGARNP